ncbi:hypothetical protein Q31b_04150 [Novipirellula aureliae]|uniref:Uncharacterized protein n=1 Tax=Novipirellula aureliae TaxID=2527966 RepID=A0A5C6E9D6_9BACT|nr:hypothetical protein [Novipirellula aureliae]TWU45244.1 hypothetical protein Q31b_04150 [Novipirellula aureliae]
MSDLNRDIFYKHSGRMGLAVPAILIIGLPAVAVLSAIYSYIVVYCPVIGYVNILFLGGYIVAGGFVLAALAKISKCRSPMILFLLGLVAGLVGLYFAWVFFIHAYARYAGQPLPIIPLVLSPAGIWEMTKAINGDGWWGPSGIAQWALVSIEAVAIVGGLTLLTMNSIDQEAFCEDCGTWCDSFETMYLAMPAEIAGKKSSELNHLELLALDEVDTSTYPRIDAEVLQCSGCKKTQAIRFKKVHQYMDEGQLKESSEAIPGILMQRSS